MSKKRRKKVALLVETSNAYARGLLSGIISYEQRHASWSVFLPEQERGGKPPKWLAQWDGDGIIARIETKQIARVVKQLKLPVVDVSAARHLPELPWIETNDHEIARLAAEHLIERGFQNIAYCGDSSFNWSNWRLEGFRLALEAADIHCHEHQSVPKSDPQYSWNRESKQLSKWISKLPKPVGILACYDIKAQQLLDTCREMGVSVPEQVAVIGVDDDRLICDLCSPPLTSVIPNAARAGYEAAALLDRLMSGKKSTSEPILIDPIGIQERQSTDVVAVEDEEVASALRFIRENATTNIRVADVVKHVDLSRRKLEHRFEQLVGRTPHQEIQRRRIDRVKQLLSQTNLPVAEIAHLTGYAHSEYLCVAFQRETGQNMSEYRDSIAVSQSVVSR